MPASFPPKPEVFPIARHIFSAQKLDGHVVNVLRPHNTCNSLFRQINWTFWAKPLDMYIHYLGQWLVEAEFQRSKLTILYVKVIILTHHMYIYTHIHNSRKQSHIQRDSEQTSVSA